MTFQSNKFPDYETSPAGAPGPSNDACWMIWARGDGTGVRARRGSRPRSYHHHGTDPMTRREPGRAQGLPR